MFIKKNNVWENTGVSRRGFLKAGTALGAAAALSSLPTNSFAQSTPKRGGNLRVGFGHGATTDSLDPSLSSNGFMSNYCFTVHSHLMEVDNEGKLIGLLAESIEATSPDALEWVCKLRTDVEFHNGQKLIADDVIASIEYHRGEDSKSVVKATANQISSMRKDGDNTVIFTLTSGNADFPYIMSSRQLAILPSEDGKINPTSGVGAGAYMIESFDPGVRMALKRSPNFFIENRAWFDTVEMLAIVDPVARQNALTTDTVDVIDGVSLKTIHLLKKNPTIEVLDVTGTKHYTLPMRTDTGPFDNLDVRLALKYSIDREEILYKVLQGYGAVGNDHPVSPTDRYFNTEIPQRAYDPEKAKFHLKKAGMDSLKVELSVAEAAFAGATDTADLFSNSAKASGIEMVVNRVPNDGYWANVWMKEPFTFSFWSGRPTTDWTLTDAYAEKSTWNESFWKHDRFNSLLVGARAELDDSLRREMYYEMQVLVRDEGGSVIPMFANHVMAHSNKVQHGKVAGNWDLDGGKAIERWWFV